RDLGIFPRADALQQEFHIRELLAQALEIVPGEGGLIVLPGGCGTPGFHEALGNVALASRVDIAVDGDAEGVVTRTHGLLHTIGRPSRVTAHIELIDLGTVPAFHDVLEPERRHRADQHADARRTGTLGDGNAAARLER